MFMLELYGQITTNIDFHTTPADANCSLCIYNLLANDFFIIKYTTFIKMTKLEVMSSECMIYAKKLKPKWQLLLKKIETVTDFYINRKNRKSTPTNKFAKPTTTQLQF